MNGDHLNKYNYGFMMLPFSFFVGGIWKMHHLFLAKYVYKPFKSVLSAFNDCMYMSSFFLILLNTDAF